MENHYMKTNAELQISQTQKKCNKTEELLLEEVEVITAALGRSQMMAWKLPLLTLPQLTDEGEGVSPFLFDLSCCPNICV